MRRFALLALSAVLCGLAFAQEPPVSRDAQLTVVVRDEQGNAVTGARVICAATRDDVVSEPLPETLEGVTDADGRCSFNSLPRTMHSILARTDTHGAWGRANLNESAAATVELTLKRGLSREIMVNDPQGKPISGVSLIHDRGLLVGRTDESGRAVLPNLDPREACEIEFLKEGLGLVWESYQLNAGRAEIVMKPGALLEGTVKDAGGQVVSGALLRAGPFETRSDENGKFRLGWVSLEQTRIPIYIHWQEGSEYLFMLHEVDAKPGANEVDPVVRPPDTVKETHEEAAVEGKVVMKGTGEPVRSTICFSDSEPPVDWYLPSQRATNPDGTFRIEGLRGDRRIYLGAAPERKTLYCTNGIVPVDLVKGQTVKDVVLTVDEGCAIGGKVLDSEGKAVPGARISLEPRPLLPLSPGMHSTGAFILSNLDRPGTPYTITVEAPGLLQPVQYKVNAVGKGEMAQVEIRVDAPAPVGTLRGIVVDIHAKPVAAAQVVLIAEEQTELGTTDDEGRFEVPFRVREGRHVALQVKVPQLLYLGDSQVRVDPDVEIVTGGEADLEPGKTIEAERTVLRILPSRHMTGRVTDPAGAPVNAYVTALSGKNDFPVFAQDGSFVLPKLPNTPYVIEVTAKGYRARVLEPGRDFPADAEKIQITLNKGPFAESRSVFSQVTGQAESADVIESLPAGELVQERCRKRYPALAGN